MNIRQQLTQSRPLALEYARSIFAIPEDPMWGTIKKIAISPIKSLGMLQLTDAEVTPSGLAATNVKVRDRMAMIGIRRPDGQYTRISQREVPELSRIKCEVNKETIIYHTPGHPTLLVRVDDLIPKAKDAQPKIMQIYKDRFLTTYDGPAPVTNWIRGYLKMTERFSPDEIARIECLLSGNPTNADAVCGGSEDVRTMLTDGAQLHVASESTLLWMNMLMQEKNPGCRWIEMEAFRPNIVIKGWPPNGEDVIDRVMLTGQTHNIGQLQFASLCVRCTTVTSGYKDKQPLAWLKDNRPPRGIEGNSVTFGVNALLPDCTGGFRLSVQQRVLSNGERNPS
jgi:uncharacterized protein YcbX